MKFRPPVMRCEPMHTSRPAVTEKEVKKANRVFYDGIAAAYETTDGRRTPALCRFLKWNLRKLRVKAKGGKLLDLGTGSGVVLSCAKGIFNCRIGLDISFNMLSTHRSNCELGVVGDVDFLPFPDDSFDLVTGFATLHHLYDFSKLIGEVTRVLKPGGIFYTDHDMDLNFRNRFRRSLSLYRWLKDASAKYGNANETLNQELYQLSEYQENGIDSKSLVNAFTRNGFSVHFHYHWFGLSALTNHLIGSKSFTCGWAPLFSMTAIKSYSYTLQDK